MNKYAARLLKLAEKLDWVAKEKPEQWNYGTWVGDNWQGKTDLSCGTQACALGWATTIPQFRKAGVIFKFMGPRNWNTIEARTKVRDYLDINDKEFSMIFLPALMEGDETLGKTRLKTDASAKRVAKHIRKFVEYKYGEVEE